MEIRLSQYQAVILNKAIGIFRTRKIKNNTLIDDAYVLQKQLATWISINTDPTGAISNTAAVTADALLAFNKAIKAQAKPLSTSVGNVGSGFNSTQIGGAGGASGFTGNTGTDNRTDGGRDDFTFGESGGGDQFTLDLG